MALFPMARMDSGACKSRHARTTASRHAIFVAG